jgi:hypothetical protein
MPKDPSPLPRVLHSLQNFTTKEPRNEVRIKIAPKPLRFDFLAVHSRPLETAGTLRCDVRACHASLVTSAYVKEQQPRTFTTFDVVFEARER